MRDTRADTQTTDTLIGGQMADMMTGLATGEASKELFHTMCCE